MKNDKIKPPEKFIFEGSCPGCKCTIRFSSSSKDDKSTPELECGCAWIRGVHYEFSKHIPGGVVTKINKTTCE